MAFVAAGRWRFGRLAVGNRRRRVVRAHWHRWRAGGNGSERSGSSGIIGVVVVIEAATTTAHSTTIKRA